MFDLEEFSLTDRGSFGKKNSQILHTHLKILHIVKSPTSLPRSKRDAPYCKVSHMTKFSQIYTHLQARILLLQFDYHVHQQQ
jgi:hypothetical protein